MMGEIRSFVSLLGIGSYDGMFASNHTMLIIERLRSLGGVILAPLRLISNDEEERRELRRRRRNSYLLPLDLIPIILSSMDALEDVEFWDGSIIGTSNGTNDVAAIASRHDADNISGEVIICLEDDPVVRVCQLFALQS